MGKSDSLTRDPADWATDCGWISRRRALNIGSKLNELAWCMENAMEGDAGVIGWAKEVRRIAKVVAPDLSPGQRRAAARKKVAAMRER